MTEQLEGQMTIFDFLKPEPLVCHFSGHTCNKENLWEVADALDDLFCPHVCCRNCDTRHCGARCNGSEEPEKLPTVGEYVDKIGKRILFKDILVDHYYIVDYSTQNHRWYKVVYVKWIEDDSVAFVDKPKGIKGEWTWGNTYSGLARKLYIDAERKDSTVFGMADTSGWWYELPGETSDDYIREHPTCFYVFGHYLDKADGWHKVPEELPTFSEWTAVDVVLFGKKTGTPWMEHGKWEAKDWTFRSIDQRRDTESTEILAWKTKS